MPEQRVQPELTQSQIELEARDKRRLETFIDAVFAIAITLLGLGLVVPIVQHSNEVLSASLASMGPKFIGYFLAFALLGILLNSHWRQFQNIVYADWVLYFINILFLSFVVLIPFATTVWTTYPDTTAGVLFFHCVMFITGLILYANWSYVRRRKYLLKKDIAVRTLRAITFRNASLPIASALAIVIAFVSPPISNVAYVLIGVMMAMAPLHARSRRGRSGRQPLDADEDKRQNMPHTT
jgi:Predicted integral membrane protein